MTFQMFDEERARSLAGVVKNDGLWKSDKQARYSRTHMRLRVNAYYDDQHDDLEAEYDDGSRFGVTLKAGQVFTQVDGVITFAPTAPSPGWSGREGGNRPWTKVFVLDGVGVVWAAKAKFKKAKNGGWDVHALEMVFERDASGPDHWSEQDEQRAAEDAGAADAPSGRVEVEGRVLSTKFQDNDFGGTFKMLVLDERGFRVWMSIPSRMLGIDAGSLVHVKVTLTPSDDDAKFAFGLRPTEVSGCKCDAHRNEQVAAV